MSMNRAGALALILGTGAYLMIMALHPSHAGAPILGHLSLSALVHGAALVTAPALAFGAFALTGFLGFDRPLPVLALVFYGLGTASVLAAATMSGLVMPEIVAAAHAPDADPGESFRQIARLTGWLNQAFANVHVALMSIGIILWSIAWPGRGGARWTVGGLGLVVGLGVLAWQLSGTLTLNVHGMGAVVLAHGVWTILAAVLLWRGRGAGV